MESRYNPDVLNCIANLSNDEVFTPPSLANQLIDLLPKELFTSPETKFLDPFTKSGVFLREIVKRLDKGLKGVIPDTQERIDHIMHHQVYGIACTELTSLLARRSLYCSKWANSKYSASHFDTPEGNVLYKAIPHTWEGGKCKYCGASQSVYDRGAQAEQYAYQFIHTDNPAKLFGNMKFDVIIGNPPYQLNDGGGTGSSAMPLYHKFVEQAIKLHPQFLCMIIPARWYAGGKGLDEFRSSFLNNHQIRYLVDYANSADCFPGVIIAGGVCYFLWDKKHNGSCNVVNMHGNCVASKELRKLNEFSTFVRDNLAIKIIRKVSLKNETSLSNVVQSRNCFSVISSFYGHGVKGYQDIVLFSLKGKSYISEHEYNDRFEIKDKYKVIITKAMSGGNKPSSEGDYLVISSLSVLEPKEICTETYLCLNTFDSKSEADNMVSYVKTKIFRFLLLQALTSINISKEKFQFVPLQDFSHPWTDEMLYKKYGLTDEEIAFIESMIRPME